MPSVARLDGRGGRPYASGLCMTTRLRLACDLKPGIGSLQRNLRPIEIDLGIAALQSFLGAALRLAGALHIDLFPSFGGLGKNGDFIRKNFGESPGHAQTMRVAAH